MNIHYKLAFRSGNGNVQPLPERVRKQTVRQQHATLLASRYTHCILNCNRFAEDIAIPQVARLCFGGQGIRPLLLDRYLIFRLLIFYTLIVCRILPRDKWEQPVVEAPAVCRNGPPVACFCE